MNPVTTPKGLFHRPLLRPWPRAWEFGLAFVLGICSVMVVQSAWKLMVPQTAVTLAAAGVDLNSADVGVLRQLPGVGPHLAARIVDHREKHGPYQRVEDLRAVKGIGPTTLERMRPVVMVAFNPEGAVEPPAVQPLRAGPKQLPAEPIDLNTASVEQFMMLPGIGPAMAERIVTDRKEKGLFGSVQDLTRIKGIKGKTLEKLLPHVTVKKREAGA